MTKNPIMSNSLRDAVEPPLLASAHSTTASEIARIAQEAICENRFIVVTRHHVCVHQTVITVADDKSRLYRITVEALA